MHRRNFLSALAGGSLLASNGCYFFRPKATVASKATTEQRILAEIISQRMESQVNARVTRKFGLGDTSILHPGILNNELDIYIEYSGEAILHVLKEQASGDADRLWDRVRAEYARVYKLDFFPSLGINNKYAMAIPAKLAEEKNIRTLSDAVSSDVSWRVSATQEFMGRREGYAALMSNYQLDMVKAPVTVEPERIYVAMDDGITNIAAGNETDGMLSTGKYVALGDDKDAFTHWQACIVARMDLMEKGNGLKPALASLSAKFTNTEMRKLCFQVDAESVPAAVVARDWLKSKSL